VVNATPPIALPPPPSPPAKDPVPIVQEAGWPPEPFRTKAENLASTGIRSPDRPARSMSLYRLGYPGSPFHVYRVYSMGIKRLGRKVNPSSSSNDEVKNEWCCTYSPTKRLHDVDSFTFFTLVPSVLHIYADIAICQHVGIQ